MTLEDKQLLLVDICTRLPYGVKMSQPDGNMMGIYTSYLNGGSNKNSVDLVLETSYVGNNLPYLRPMSSMTEEEEIEYDATFVDVQVNGHHETTMSYKTFDFLNRKMFDYRGLIEKGLALEALGGMYG